MMKQKILFTVSAVALAPTSTARATEGGSGHYARGSSASFVDALSDKPSFAVFNYFTYYDGSANASRLFPIARQVAFNVED